MTDWCNGMQAMCIKQGLPDIAFGQHPFTVRSVTLLLPGDLVLTMADGQWLQMTRDTLFLQFIERPGDLWYPAEWFRPLQKLKRETDISLLKKLLVPTTKVKENV